MEIFVSDNNGLYLDQYNRNQTARNEDGAVMILPIP